MIEKKFYGERLRSARMYRGLTLTELAKRTEISKQSISLYENDNNTPDYMKVRLLASELNFPYDYFFQKDSYCLLYTSKKVCIICSFDITDKPSVHILAIHTSGSGLSVECSGIGRRKADGIFYCIDVFRSKSKVVILQLG